MLHSQVGRISLRFWFPRSSDIILPKLCKAFAVTRPATLPLCRGVRPGLAAFVRGRLVGRLASPCAHLYPASHSRRPARLGALIVSNLLIPCCIFKKKVL